MPQDPSTFREDLAAGQAVEQAVGAWAIGRGWTAHRACGRVEGYDLLLTCTIEVKADRMAPESGNVAVEASFRGKPSGIAATTATWWCIAVGDVGYVVRTSKLRALAEQFAAVPAGYGKLARVHLVPLAKLAEISQQIHLPGIDAAPDVPSAAPNVEPEASKPTESTMELPESTQRTAGGVLRQSTLFDKEPSYEYGY